MHPKPRVSGEPCEGELAIVDAEYAVRRPHIEADVAGSEYANVLEPVVSNQAANGRRQCFSSADSVRSTNRYRVALADIAAASPSRGGTSNAEIGIASSSARSRPRVARQYLGDSSR
jgi:hypothetical protein